MWELQLFPTLHSVPSGGSLRWPMVGWFVPQRLANATNTNTTNPGLSHHPSPSQRELVAKHLGATTDYVWLARNIITRPHLAVNMTGNCSLDSTWLCAHLKKTKTYFTEQRKHDYWRATSRLHQHSPPLSSSHRFVPGNRQDSESVTW